MQEFKLTFGVQYNHLPHPQAVMGADPGGWVTIVAESEEAARLGAMEMFGQRWSMLTPADRFRPGYFPKGEVARYTVTMDPAEGALCRPVSDVGQQGDGS